MFEREVFRKQMYSIEESTCDIGGRFGAPRSHSAPRSDLAPPQGFSTGELCPSCPLVTPLLVHHNKQHVHESGPQIFLYL